MGPRLGTTRLAARLHCPWRARRSPPQCRSARLNALCGAPDSAPTRAVSGPTIARCRPLLATVSALSRPVRQLCTLPFAGASRAAPGNLRRRRRFLLSVEGEIATSTGVARGWTSWRLGMHTGPMSGWDKSPEYGGPPVTRWTMPILLVAFVAASLTLLWLRF